MILKQPNAHELVKLPKYNRSWGRTAAYLYPDVRFDDMMASVPPEKEAIQATIDEMVRMLPKRAVFFGETPIHFISYEGKFWEPFEDPSREGGYRWQGLLVSYFHELERGEKTRKYKPEE